MSSDQNKRTAMQSIRGVLTSRLLEAELSWVSGLVLFFSTVYAVVTIDVLWVVFGITALSLYILPVVAARDPFKALPFEMTLLLVAPMLLHISAGSERLTQSVTWWRDFTSLAFSFSLATIGFLLTVELQMFTSIKMNRPFSVFFVFMFTLGVAGYWQVGRYFGDKVWNTSRLGSNYDVMVDLVWATIGGVVMGGVYYLYLKAMPKKRQEVLDFMHMWEVTSWKRG